jgi:hypothetical protein
MTDGEPIVLRKTSAARDAPTKWHKQSEAAKDEHRRLPVYLNDRT